VQRLSEKHAIDFVPSGALTLATNQVPLRHTPHAARRINAERRILHDAWGVVALLHSRRRCAFHGGRSSWS
jgi:hypothetical protein